ncbi:hypothetical protein DFH27DRAFT_581118, partial [Peziza echinospora]
MGAARPPSLAAVLQMPLRLGATLCRRPGIVCRVLPHSYINTAGINTASQLPVLSCRPLITGLDPHCSRIYCDSSNSHLAYNVRCLTNTGS